MDSGAGVHSRPRGCTGLKVSEIGPESVGCLPGHSVLEDFFWFCDSNKEPYKNSNATFQTSVGNVGFRV